MKAQEIISEAREAIQVKRVFGEPYEKNGITVIPAAHVRGGWGGGEGPTPNQRESRWGVGGGLMVRPAGVYVIKGNAVEWKPAIDPNRIIFMGQVVAIVAILTIAWTVRGSRKKR